MRVVVQDASVLIDLGAAELLDAWFDLGIETLTTSFAWREVNRRSQKNKLRQFARDQRIQVVAISSDVLSELLRKKMDLPRQLSLNDVSVLHLAVTRKAVLLTGDQCLRTCAETSSVEVHGLLWLLDYMVDEHALSPSSAARKLELICRLNPRLPKTEIEMLLDKWRRG